MYHIVNFNMVSAITNTK